MVSAKSFRSSTFRALLVIVLSVMSVTSSSSPPVVDPLVRVAQLEAQVAQLVQHAQSQVASSPRRNDSQLPKLRSPSMFTGGMGMVVDSWFSELKQQFSYYGAKFSDDAAKVAFAAAHFSGDALKWWEYYDQASIASWDSFVEALHTRFRPVQASQTARQHIGKLRMRDSHSVNQYVSVFQTTLTPIVDMGEADKVHHFVNGLLPAYFGRVWDKNPKTLKDAIEAAVSVEAIIKYGRDAGRSYSGHGGSYGSVGSHGSPSSSAPMEISHIDLDSFLSSDSSSPSSDIDSINAVLLAKLHAVDQRLNALAFGSGRSAPPRRENDRIAGLTPEKIAELRKAGKCFRCKEVGHMKNECPKRK